MILKRSVNLITVFLIALLVGAFSITQFANAASMAYCLDKESEPTEGKVVKYIWDDPVDVVESEEADTETEAEAKAEPKTESETALFSALKANGFEGKDDQYEAVKDLLVKVLYYGHPQTKDFTKEETAKAIWWVVKNANTIGKQLSDIEKKDDNYNALCEKAFKGDMPQKWQMYVYVNQPEDPEDKAQYFVEGEFSKVGFLSSRNPTVLSGKQTVKEAIPEKPLTESNTGTYNSRDSSTGSQSTSTTNTNTNTNNAVTPDSSNNTTTNTTNNNSANTSSTTRTGDDAMLTLIFLIAITSLGLVIACLLRRRSFGK